MQIPGMLGAATGVGMLENPLGILTTGVAGPYHHPGEGPHP